MNQGKGIRSSRTEQALMEAMLAMLEKKDFSEITVRDICRVVAVSRSTFYLHFEDKYDLAIECVRHYIMPPSELFAEHSLEAYFSRLLSAEYAMREPIKRLIRYEGDREIQWKITLLSVGALRRYYREITQEDNPSHQIMAIYNCSGIINLIWWWVQNDCPTPKEYMVDRIVHLLRQSHDLLCL